jgi:hypothetical protein
MRYVTHVKKSSRNSPRTLNTTLLHEGDDVREFYSKLPRPVRVGWESNVRSAIQRKFAPRNLGSRNMIGGMRI